MLKGSLLVRFVCICVLCGFCLILLVLVLADVLGLVFLLVFGGILLWLFVVCGFGGLGLLLGVGFGLSVCLRLVDLVMMGFVAFCWWLLTLWVVVSGLLFVGDWWFGYMVVLV